MDTRKREDELDDTQIRRDTEVRGSLGLPPSGLTDEEWQEQEGAEDAPAGEQPRKRPVADDDDRVSER